MSLLTTVSLIWLNQRFFLDISIGRVGKKSSYTNKKKESLFTNCLHVLFSVMQFLSKQSKKQFWDVYLLYNLSSDI